MQVELWGEQTTGWCCEAEKQRVGGGGGGGCWQALQRARDHLHPGELLKGASVCQKKKSLIFCRVFIQVVLAVPVLLQLPALHHCWPHTDAASSCWCRGSLCLATLSRCLSQPHGGLPGWLKVPSVQKVRVWRKTGDLFQDLGLDRLSAPWLADVLTEEVAETSKT